MLYAIEMNDFHGNTRWTGQHRKLTKAVARLRKYLRQTNCECGGCAYIVETRTAEPVSREILAEAEYLLEFYATERQRESIR